VTHDQHEAAALGDRIAIMNNGRLEQIGTAAELYSNPANLFVASFFGPEPINLVRGRIEAQCFIKDGLRVPVPAANLDGKEVFLACRPDDLELAPGGAIRGKVHSIDHLGWCQFARVSAASTIFRLRLNQAVAPDAQIHLNVKHCFLFETQTGRRVL
jgi:multiple sugar transport system ATP-binding protein